MNIFEKIWIGIMNFLDLLEHPVVFVLVSLGLGLLIIFIITGSIDNEESREDRNKQQQKKT